MIDKASVRAVDASRWSGRFVKPLYGSYCFSQVPPLLLSLFGGVDAELQRRLLGPLAGGYDTVILLFIDAFGWRSWERFHLRFPFLRHFEREGVVVKLTSQFPSTTSAHTTTIHTGLEVGQSGVYEWFMYEPAVDAVIAPLLFSFARHRERNTLSAAGVKPATIFPWSRLYTALARMGVESFLFQSAAFTPSPFSDVTCQGAHLRPYATPRDGLSCLADTALSRHGPTYLFFYNGEIDLAGHRHGPDSAGFRDVAATCFEALESVLHARLSGKLGSALLLLIADHGQVQVDPARTIYLNRLIPAAGEWLQPDRQGRPVGPSGSTRDMFLHVRPECLDEACERATEALSGRAEVYRVDDLIAGGFFGQEKPSRAFLDRVGNVVVLPYESELVWWADLDYAVPPFRGHHGGLSPEEMETVLLALPL